MPTAMPAPSHSFFVVAIGASAGGIEALKQFCSLMPPDSGMAFVIVLHLSNEHESHLAAILQNETKMPVQQVTKTLTVEPDHIYVIPPTKHLRLIDGVVVLAEPDQRKGRRVPIDLLFRTLGEAYGEKGVGIVLSGTGSDGTIGLKHLKEYGGTTIVQTPEEAEYDGMPRSAIETGLVDLVLPIAEMPSKLISIKKSSEEIDGSGRIEKMVSPDEKSGDILHDILNVLRIQTGHDFSSYKRPTLLRRVARRMQVHGITHPQDYRTFLGENPHEIQMLLGDLLISVTNFFRDSHVFEALERDVVPRLFHGKKSSDTIRIWVPACATGEEAYSIAMLLYEHADKLPDPPTIQIFASDIDTRAVAIARACSYNESTVSEISPERLQRFFTKDGDKYTIVKSLRELILFAPHNVLRDPPFSRIDLISCRNLLIYLTRETQKNLFNSFHFALRNSGFLLLGSSESADGVSELFAPLDKVHRIYQALPVSPNHNVPSIVATGSWRTQSPSSSTPISYAPPLPFSEIHYRILEKYGPPSVLINDEAEILHLSESVGRFLRMRGGDPSRNLLKIVHPGLRSELRAVLIEARHERRDTRSVGITIDVDGESVTIDLIVLSLNVPMSSDYYYVVLFSESAALVPPIETATKQRGDGESYVRRLEEELQHVKDHLRITNEQNETSDEELRASNEELQAILEEVRSTSEELETSKEELQSVNEELMTLNHELKSKIDEVGKINADMVNLLSSTHIPTLFLDRGLCIKRYTPSAEALFNVIPSDIGRPITHVTHTLDYNEFANDASKVLRTLTPIDREIRDKNGSTFIARFLPYRTLHDKIDGVVLTFLDITDRKHVEETRRWLTAVSSSANDTIVSFTLDRQIVGWNSAAERMFGYSAAEALGKDLVLILGIEEEKSRKMIDDTISIGELLVNYEIPCRKKNGESIQTSLSILPIMQDAHNLLGVTLFIQDITARREKIEGLEGADRNKDRFLSMLAHELRNPLAPILNGIEAIKEDYSDTEMVEQMIQVIERQSRQVIRLVDDLLDVARITQGKVHLRKSCMDLRAAVDIAVETIKGLISEKKHLLEVSLPSDPLYLDADLTRISQIILNLLNNAARYTPHGGKLLLSAEQMGDQVEIRVRDNGVGIDPATFSSIFEMFNQAPNGGAHVIGGLGVGLAVVKKFVEMHDGTVTVRSDGKEMGSEFIVRLPGRAEPCPPKLNGEQRSGLSVKNPEGSELALRVLIADDNSDAALMLNLLLSAKHKHNVRTAWDGESAITIALKFKPDVCLLDIGMPDIDGYEVARRIREKLPDALLIALTGWGMDEDRRRSHEAGFDHHIVKPVDAAKLQELLDERSRK